MAIFIDGLSGLVLDAVPQGLPENINENRYNTPIKYASLLSEFSVEDYKSAFFLLMDFVGLDDFLQLTKKDVPTLKHALIRLYQENFIDDSMFVELLGTLKMYKKLKLLGICSHVYESQEKKFNQIDGIWKILYSLCEELTDDDVQTLKQGVPSTVKNKIQSAEDWFCWALQEEKFSRTDLSNLERLFCNYPKCLNIIKNYEGFGSYYVKTPTVSSDCGIAVIINLDKFDENTGLSERKSSNMDVKSLKELWENFGFQTHIHSNLTHSEIHDILVSYAKVDHSKYNAFICCILSHGQSNSIYSRDGKLVEIRELIAPITNECLTLNKKPKLFFIQACQGVNVHQGVGKPIYQVMSSNTAVTKSCNSSVPPVLCDSLIVNSTIDGFVSFRDSKGSWFIQALCKLMMQYGATSSIEEVMIKVSEKVSKLSANFGPSGLQGMQTPHRSTTLRKKLILKKRRSC